MAERISPGISVAINREPKDSPVIDAYNINGKLGGNSMPRVPPAAKSPMQNVRLYPLDSISGMAIMLTVAATATLDPVIDANKQQNNTDAMPKPPGRWRTSVSANR